MDDMEVDILSPLRDCLLQISQGKAVEKKKQIDNLKLLLKRKDVLNLLDKNTSKRRPNDSSWCSFVNWPRIFSVVKGHIQQEAERLQEKESSAGRPSALVLANRNKEKKCCSELFRYIVKVIKNRYLPGVFGKIIDHLLAVLTNSFTLDAFGFDYTNVLLKEILTASHLCLEIGSEVFESLLELYCKLMKSPPSGWDRGTLAQVLHQLLSAAHQHYDVKSKPLLEFFIGIFSSMKLEKATRFHEFLLRSLMLLCQNIGSSCRTQLCYLGEAIILPLIHLWKTKPTEPSKELMMEFFLLQLALHHPQGAVNAEVGAFACDWSVWKNLLNSLYQLIMREIDEVCTRNKYSSSKDYSLHPSFISVAIEVCAQVFQDPSPSVEITQMQLTCENGPATKKRRIEVGFKVFLDALQSPSSEILPWLQLLSALLSKYKSVASLDDIVTVVNVLIDIHLASNQIEMKVWLLSSCQAAVEAYCTLSTSSAAAEIEAIDCQWTRLWELGVKCVSLMHQCHETGHKLLSTLLQHKLITPKTEFFNLYSAGSNNKVSKSSATTLLIFLRNYGEPASMSSHYNKSLQQASSKDGFRHQLLNWLFQMQNDDEFENFTSQISSSSINSICAFSLVVTSMCLQDYKNFKSRHSILSFSETVHVSWIAELQQQALLCSFDLPFLDKTLSANNPQHSQTSQVVDLSVQIWKHVTDLLCAICDKLLQNNEQLRKTGITIGIKYAYFILSIAKSLFLCGVLTKEDVFESSLVDKLKNLVSNVLQVFHSKEAYYDKQSPLKTILPFLTVMLENDDLVPNMKKDDIAAVQEISVKIVPEELCGTLLSILELDSHEKEAADMSTITDMDMSFCSVPASQLSQMALQSSGISMNTSRRRNRYDTINQNVEVVSDLSFADEEVDNSTMAYYDPMDLDNASTLLKLQLECADLLTLLCKLETHRPQSFVFSEIPGKLMEVIETKRKELVKKPEIVYLILKLLQAALLLKDLSLEHLNCVVSMLRNLLNKYSKYRTVCVQILSLFQDVYPHLFQYNRGNAGTETDHTMHLLHVLWTKDREGKCNKDVSYALTEAIGKLLEYESHITWSTNQSVSNGGSHSETTTAFVIEDYFCLLQSEHLQVSLRVACQTEFLNKYFVTATSQMKWFDHMCRKCLQNISDSNCEERGDQDVMQNQVSSFVHFLCHVFFACSALSEKSLFIFCQLLKDKKASPQILVKALSQVSNLRGHESVKEFLDSHVTYLLDEWLERKYSITEFPIMLFDFNSLQDFFKLYYVSLVPLHLYHSDFPSVQLVSDKLNRNVKNVIHDCLPKLLARISSWYCDGVNTAEAEQCLQLLEKTLTKKVISNFTKEHVDDIVTNLLDMVEDSSFTGNSISQSPSSRGIHPTVFLETISRLKMEVSWTDSFVQFLCQKRDSIQNILLFIYIRLFKAGTDHEKLKALLMYQIFIDLLVLELRNGLDTYHVFIVTELIHALMGFLSKEYSVDENCIFLVCIDLIQKVCEAAMVLYQEDIGTLLPFMVSQLILIASTPKYEQKAVSLLSYLVVDCSHHLEQYIIHLDPFPENPCFQHLKQKHKSLMYKKGPYTLEMEMEHFIQSYKATASATLEGLKHLLYQLRVRKNDLLLILNGLQETTLFYEDTKSRRFHFLVWSLVRICILPSSSKEIQIEASRCLGEIGPVNHSTMVLQTFQGEKQSANQENAIFNEAYCDILKILYSYLKEHRTTLKVTSSLVLKEVFKAKEAQKFLSASIQKDENWLQYLYPFQFQSKAKKKLDLSDFPVRAEKIDSSELWLPRNHDFSTWIRNLVFTLVESGITKNEFFEKLIPICKEEESFCSKILPYLVHAIMVQNDEVLLEIISRHFSSFFRKVSEELDKKTAGSLNGACSLSKASIQVFLSIVNYLRLQVKPMNENHVCNNSWTGLNLDYLHVAQASHYCSAYFSAILYAELWYDSVRERNTLYPGKEIQIMKDFDVCSPDSSPMTVLNTEDQDRIALVYKILSDAYSGIGDADGIFGCIEITTNSQSVVQNHYIVEKKWDKLLSFYDTDSNASGVLKALRNCGLDHTLQNYLQSQFVSYGDVSAETIEYQCECAWRMGQWEVPIPERENPGFQEECYKSLQCLYNDNKSGFSKHIEISRDIVFQNLSHTSLESVRSILPTLTSLQMLVLMEDYSELILEKQDLNSFQGKWCEQKKLPYADFEFLDPVSWLHCVLLKQRLKGSHRPDAVVEELTNCLEQHAIHARENFYLEAATRSIHHLKLMSLNSPDDLLRWQIEEAKVLWTKKEHSIANRLLKSALYSVEKSIKSDPNDLKLKLIYAKTLSLRGKLLEETCSENSTVIMNMYLEKSISVLENAEHLGQKELLWDAHLAVARYADRQYQSIVNYKNSTAFQAKHELMADATNAINKLKSTKHMSDDQKKTCCILVRQHKIDEGELNDMNKDQQQFLMKAISSYLVCLQGTDAHDLWVFRLTALWFQNLSNDSINEVIKDGLDRIETYKFLPLMYQLAARMGTQSNSQFCSVLSRIIKKIACDHPHHALPIILSMSNADKDPSDTSSSGKQSTDSVRKERTIAAAKIVDELRSTKLGKLLKDMSALCNAYISLAYMSATQVLQAKQKVADIPPSELIMKIRNFSRVPVITENTKIDRSCEYSNVVGIHSFLPEFRLCGGINVPKVVTCIGMDGIKREQLVKGRDDLRQDAVMQQVFHLVNCLLKENNETKKRKLHIRTYKVVPMSRRSGVLQWCAGTQPLSQYLVGPEPPGGAHKKYYPQFWTHIQCQKAMKTIANYSSLARKRQIYDELCKNFPPVFRYFFLENFPEPSAWFERRQSYTKSVATSSIVGYILGLGDRHVNNILIDKYTAEFVHIDFGIAFEKGRILHTPETVPFRMTRDVVDGMGFVGVEGVFKRCCEKTLEVMRNSQDVLLTILEVLLYDPLYDWAIPTGKSSLSAPQIQYDGQSGSSETASNLEVNKLAERALMRLQQKLQGLEEGMALSVSGQVNLLIQQARDPNNLCKLYAGWQPYL